MHLIILLIILSIFTKDINSAEGTYLILEGGATWQTRNIQAIPGNTGTRFNISDFEKGPLFSYRLYLGKKINNRHELRVLYAPLSFETQGHLSQNVTFLDSVFEASSNTKIFYKFNSYRLTYAYHLNPINSWKFAVGFTAKVRDAQVKLSQAIISEAKTNIGFVPLFHFQALKELGPSWFFRLDIDGLASPQGRAIDLALFIEHAMRFKDSYLFAGYRTVEGGADNKEVYSFAWIHTLTGGWKKHF